MSSITPRSEEVSALLEILESEFESYEDAAKVIFKKCWSLIQERETITASRRSGPGEAIISWGPFTSESEAKKFIEKVSLGGEWILTKVNSVSEQLRKE